MLGRVVDRNHGRPGKSLQQCRIDAGASRTPARYLRARILPREGASGKVTLTAPIWQPRNPLVNMLHAKVLAVLNGEDAFVRAVGVGAGEFSGHCLSRKLDSPLHPDPPPIILPPPTHKCKARQRGRAGHCPRPATLVGRHRNSTQRTQPASTNPMIATKSSNTMPCRSIPHPDCLRSISLPAALTAA